MVRYLMQQQVIIAWCFVKQKTTEIHLPISRRAALSSRALPAGVLNRPPCPARNVLRIFR
jgi:hypothetical protein